MQQRDDQAPVSSRPSLLSSEQLAEADRLRAQAKAESAPELTGPAAKRGRSGWIAAGAAAVALCAGAAVWIAGESDSKLVVIPAAPAGPAPAAVAALASASASAPAEADVSIAAILDDTPPQKQESLRDMLSAPADTAAALPNDPDELSKLLESTPAAAVKPAPPAAAAVKKDVPAARAKPQAVKLADKSSSAKSRAQKDKADKADKAQAQKLAAKKKHTVRLADAKAGASRTVAKSAAKPAPVVDDDVTLLTALMANARRDNAARAVVQRKLKQCKALGADAAEQCRARLCAGSARQEPECKPPRIVKASSIP